MSENIDNYVVSEQNSGGQFIMVGDFRIRYYEQGEGQTVIFIHGLAQAMYTFRKNIFSLAKHCHVVALDLPGHGLSSKPDIDYAIDDFTILIKNFMEAMDIPKATLVGFSTGGTIALNVAVKYPELVERLVLISPGGITKQFPATIRNAKAPIISDMIFTMFNAKTVKRVLKTAFYDRDYLTGDVIRHYTRTLNKDNLDAAFTAIANWNDGDVVYALSSIQVPAYLFWGEDDEWHPLSMMELYEDALPEVYAATFAQCGHMAHIERAEEFNRKLIEILSSDN